MNLKFYNDGIRDTKVVFLDEKIQLRRSKCINGGSVWMYDEDKKIWRQITPHYFNMCDAIKEYYSYVEKQYEEVI